MDGGLQLNISLPSSDSGGSKEKRTAKQRKVEFELRRANKQKKILEIKEKKEKKKVREESKKFEKRKNPKVGPKQELKDEFASSMLRGEIMPKIHANEGRLVFPHLALNISDSSRKNRTGKIKKKFNSGAKTKELNVGKKYSEPTKKTTSLEEDENANKSALVSFVKKPKVSKNTIPDQEKTPQSKPTGTFFRKSKKASDIEKKGFQFAFGESSQKAALVEETVDFTGERAFRGRVDGSQTTVASSAAGGKVSPLKSRGGVVDAAERPRKANKRVRWDADSDAAGPIQEEEEEEEAEAAAQRSAKKMKRSGDAGDGEEEGKVWRGKFTSLFGNNPEIPAVPRRAVRPVQEPIFSDENFSDLPIHKFLRKAAPVLLAGRDALVRSQTGSGKTLAYALPLVELLQRQRPPLTRADGVRALVVLPTRELALQTYECFLKLVKRKSEKARLRKGITILVGTPGRLLDHVQHTRSLRLDKVQYLVLDEADLLLDMGYERDVASIVAELDSQSQPLLSKEVLAWNRKTYFMDKESPDENTEEKTDHKVGYTSQDSGAGEEEETSEEEVKRTREGKKKEKVEEEVRKGAEAKLAREEDETSDYDPEERADEIVDAKELEGDKWDEESSEDEEDGEEVYRKEEDVWEAEDEDDQGGGVGEGEVQGGAGAVASPKERRRQTVLLSATLTPAVERLAGLALQAPDFVDAADAEMDTKDVVIPDSLVQCYMVVPAKLRLVTLSAFILWKCKFCEERKMLLFCATQDMVDYLTELLTVVLSRKDTDEQEGSNGDDDPEDSFNVGVDFFRLHGQMDQKERTLVFQTFRAADCGVLLCTDVAARGLDLPRVDWIVQWTAPGSVPDYVHRVGRTARVGAAGAALLFLLPAEADFKMDNCLKKLSQAIHSSEFPERSSVQSAATTLQLRYENAVLNRRSLHDSAVKAYVSFVRFYASYPKEVRDVFCFKALHLGHQAKSFALRDPPRAIAGIGRRRFHDDLKQQKKEQQQRQRQRAPTPKRAAAVPKAFQAHDRSRMRNLVLSEFDSGLEIPKKTKKRPDDA
ncbi:Probable ATP-dependent RNA helicase CG8611 [Gryllus bimaculatus]|nr:Probable ATP-dependent RNA helicase CG8611 [Gryllus bimaculatus]